MCRSLSCQLTQCFKLKSPARFYRERKSAEFLSKNTRRLSQSRQNASSVRRDAGAAACFSETWVFLLCESTPLPGHYFVPCCWNKKIKEKKRKGKEKRNRVIRVKTSCLPFCRAEKKEFTTSCRHRFPVSLRPRRGRQSNLRVEGANAGKRARGLRLKAVRLSAKRRSNGCYHEGTIFS